MANMNSPLLQLPPQILQSKIIINLWRKWFPFLFLLAIFILYLLTNHKKRDIWLHVNQSTFIWLLSIVL